LANPLDHIDRVNRQIDELPLAVLDLAKQAGGVKARKLSQMREDVITETA
jgi:hypothetical protein